MIDEKTEKAAMVTLLKTPEFVDVFLLRVIQLAGILSPATDGSIDRHLAYAEGRRNLGLDILAMVETGQPVSHPDGLPILTVLQALRAEATRQPQETKLGRRTDRYSELNRSDDGDD